MIDAPQRLRKHLKKSLHLLFRGYRLPLFLSLLCTLFALWLETSSLGPVASLHQRLENLVYDQRFSLMLETRPPAEHSIVIVDYDQESLNAEGQWPWSRFKLGDLVEQLAGYGAIVVGFDVFFPENERNVVREAEARLAGEAALAGLLPELERLEPLLDGDRYFAAQMGLSDVVLGVSFVADADTREGVLPRPIIAVEEPLLERLDLLAVGGYIGNVEVLQGGAAGAGFFDTVPDLDGVIRRTPLVMEYEGLLYPSLALEMARLYFFEENFTLATETDASGRNPSVTGISMGSFRIPTDARGQVLVPYGGRSNQGASEVFRYISAVDVLRGNLSAAEEAALVNSLVLVGTTATGLFDLRSTPLESVYPGVEVHANVLDAILRTTPVVTVDGTGGEGGGVPSGLDAGGESPFPVQPDWEQGAVLAALILLGLLLSLVYPRLGPALLSLSSLTFMLGITVLNFRLWSQYQLDLSLVTILFLILLITIVNMAYGFLREGLSRREIKGMFDQYVPPAHIEAMLERPEEYGFEGESREMSVLFSDIRGFTSISESLSAAELKALLNDFFTPITEVIFANQGTIDKYVGDMVMAFWGAPLDDPRHRDHAVTAALQMLARAEELKAEFRARGFPAVNIGVGVNSGAMNVGDMGSTYRRSYTVLGDAVNLGSRLEGLTKYYGVNCLIGEDTHDALEEGFLCRLVDRVQVKGKELPVRIYEPLCRETEASAQLSEQLGRYQAACELYLARRWDDAARAFGKLCEEEPRRRLYRIYQGRIEELREAPPPADWDGTYRHTSK